MRNSDTSGSRFRLVAFPFGVKLPVAVAVFAVFMILCAANVAGDTDLLGRGEQLYLENRFEEALPVLESALVQHPRNERLYLYLGTVYEELGMLEKAISILQKGTLVADLHLDRMYFNMANSLFKQEKTALADEMYSRCIANNPRFSEAYLNRANNRVRLGNYAGAVDDYKVYLNLKPATAQRGNIEEMISLLNAGMEAEFARIRQEEERRLAEEARQRALLNEVLSSLQRASEGTTHLGIETEGIEEVRTETDIVE